MGCVCVGGPGEPGSPEWAESCSPVRRNPQRGVGTPLLFTREAPAHEMQGSEDLNKSPAPTQQLLPASPTLGLTPSPSNPCPCPSASLIKPSGLTVSLPGLLEPIMASPAPPWPWASPALLTTRPVHMLFPPLLPLPFLGLLWSLSFSRLLSSML